MTDTHNAAMQWRDMGCAPKDGTAFQARIPGHGSDNVIAWTNGLLGPDEEDAGGWFFVEDQEPPECWTDGVCWAVNADGVPSVQPDAWMPLPPSPTVGETRTDALKQRLRGKTVATGLASFPSRDNGHMVLKAVRAPDPDCQEAADRIEALEAERGKLGRQVRDLLKRAEDAESDRDQRRDVALGLEAERDRDKSLWRDELDELADAKVAAEARADRLLRRWLNSGCPDCGGDCANANPPVALCIMQDTSALLASLEAREEVSP
jgi:hypothetical protein